MSDPVRVRYAPSPTGRQHIGGCRTALYNWAWARRQGGQFVLRIEDTDKERSTREFEEGILATLAWLGIDWDEGPDKGGPYGPYRQSEKAERHREIADQLLASGWAYRAFDTPERLAELRETQEKNKERMAYDGRDRALSAEESDRRAAEGEPYVVRFKVPEGSTAFTDLVRGDVEFQNAEVDDWIMVRTDGSPTYNLVVVCDDVDMKINLVLRGEEHLVNTPKQVLLYRALGLEAPKFGHLPLMLGSDGKKLSKRTGDTALEDYRDKGYPKEAIVNFLALQGWALDGETDVFSRETLVEHFDPAKVSKGGAVFDLKKFEWMAGEYLRAESVEDLAEHCLPFVDASGLFSASELRARWDWYLRVVASERERIATYADLAPRIAYLRAADDAVEYEAKAEKNARKQEDVGGTLRNYADWLKQRVLAGAGADALRDGTKAWLGEQDMKFGTLFQPLRCALTGRAGGPDLFEVIELLGGEPSLARIRIGADRLTAPLGD